VKFQLALCQILSSFEKDESFAKAATYVKAAADAGAKVVCLPEMWNCPYDNAYFGTYAEPEGGISYAFLADLARKNKIFLVGGSVPESEGDKLYNTSYVFDPSGERIAKHRKVHLFDVDVKGGVSFRESDSLSAGNEITVFETDFGTMGVAICYDVRFPEMFAKMASLGAKLVFLPAAFNMTTGPVHWDLLMRSRALDNQYYLAACSPARDATAKYKAFGHSCIADPWGEYCGVAAAAETIVYGQIDFGLIETVRAAIPVGVQRRDDLYG
jgi:predicted amidohydrolase